MKATWTNQRVRLRTRERLADLARRCKASPDDLLDVLLRDLEERLDSTTEEAQRSRKRLDALLIVTGAA